MSLSFRNLKPGGLYVTATPNELWITAAVRPRIPEGTHFLVIEPVPRGWALGGAGGRVYRVLIDGTVGNLLVGEGDVLPVEEA